MKKLNSLWMLFALAFSACSSDETGIPEAKGNPSADGKTEILLTTGVMQEGGTRGITDNSFTATTFGTNSTIDVNIVENTTATPTTTYGSSGWVTASVTGGSNATAFTTPQYWPTSGNGVKLYAWYPASTATTYWTTARTVFKVPVTQSGSTDLKAFDLMHAPVVTGNPASRGTAIALQFTHKLAKLVVNLAPKTGGTAGITADQLKNATVTIGDVKTTVNVTPATGEVATANTPTGTLKVMDNEAGTTGYALIPAQTLSGTLTVKLKAGGTLTTTLSSFEVQAGKTNTLNVSVSLTAITITTSILNWTANPTAGSADLKL